MFLANIFIQRLRTHSFSQWLCHSSTLINIPQRYGKFLNTRKENLRRHTKITR
jgi:hypothetical protein